MAAVNFHIWSCDCPKVPNLLLCTKFHQNWFKYWESSCPLLLNVQRAVARHGNRIMADMSAVARHGNRIMADMSETTQVSSKSVH